MQIENADVHAYEPMRRLVAVSARKLTKAQLLELADILHAELRSRRGQNQPWTAELEARPA